MSEEEDILFQEAVEALRQKDQAKARTMLTQLLKSDQKNVQYWIWLSAAVEKMPPPNEAWFCWGPSRQMKASSPSR
jgi:Tfp pilus assembly protein PilF